MLLSLRPSDVLVIWQNVLMTHAAAAHESFAILMELCAGSVCVLLQ